MKMVARRYQVATALGMSVLLAACGTILHPERRGQTRGRLDVGIVLLDGVGLFFFLIPGIIAYAVDFSNGTIYLPGSKIVKFDAKHCTPETLRAVIRANSGVDVDWNDPRLISTKLENANELPARFARAERASAESGLARR